MRRKRPRSIAGWRQFALQGHRTGPEHAPVTIVEFADFQCPFCRAATGSLKVLLARYPEQIAVVFREFPLPIHQFATEAAVSAECAGRQGAFDGYHDVLYAWQDSIGKIPWEHFARAAGIRDMVAFGKCLNDTTAAAIVERDRTAGEALHVAGTPTFLVNNVQITGFPGPEALDSVVRVELESSARGDTAGQRALLGDPVTPQPNERH